MMLKAAHGGGGRGMRIVRSEGELADAFEGAQRESQTAFGSGEIFLERFIERARHLEVQLLGDGHGNLVHLRERDCSVQRRHQKVVRDRPRPEPAADRAGGDLPGGRRYRLAGRLPQRRDRRVPLRRGPGRVLLHRGQPPHPGRAHLHRAGDGGGHRQEPDPDRRRGDAGRRRDRPAEPGGRAVRGVRRPVPRHHRGPRQRVQPGLRPHLALPVERPAPACGWTRATPSAGRS